MWITLLFSYGSFCINFSAFAYKVKTLSLFFCTISNITQNISILYMNVYLMYQDIEGFDKIAENYGRARASRSSKTYLDYADTGRSFLSLERDFWPFGWSKLLEVQFHILHWILDWDFYFPETRFLLEICRLFCCGITKSFCHQLPWNILRLCLSLQRSEPGKMGGMLRDHSNEILFLLINLEIFDSTNVFFQNKTYILLSFYQKNNKYYKV